MLTIASTIHATRTGRSPATDRARREPASRRSGTGAVSGARFSRIAQLGSTRLRRRADTPRAYVEPVDRRTSVRFRMSSKPTARSASPATTALRVQPLAGHAYRSKRHACSPPGKLASKPTVAAFAVAPERKSRDAARAECRTSSIAGTRSVMAAAITRAGEVAPALAFGEEEEGRRPSSGRDLLRCRRTISSQGADQGSALCRGSPPRAA